jgi:hypothetical protein
MAGNAPIFIDAAIFDKLDEIRDKGTSELQQKPLEELSEKQLQELLTQSIEDENYEQASLIRDELERRKNTTNI